MDLDHRRVLLRSMTRLLQRRRECRSVKLSYKSPTDVYVPQYCLCLNQDVHLQYEPTVIHIPTLKYFAFFPMT